MGRGQRRVSCHPTGNGFLGLSDHFWIFVARKNFRADPYSLLGRKRRPENVQGASSGNLVDT